jgi:hypothetical protein
MFKKLMLSAAIGALMIGGAMAQSTTPSSPSSTPSASPSTTASTSPEAPSGTISRQKPDQWLASKFKGTDVVGTDNQKIGDVTDILFDKNGKIEAYIVSVGGFLGIGSKHVALPPSSFQVVAADLNSGGYDKLKLSMSKEQLKQAANFEPYNPPMPRQTTGSGLGGSGGMATRPSTNTPPASTGK